MGCPDWWGVLLRCPDFIVSTEIVPSLFKAVTDRVSVAVGVVKSDDRFETREGNVG